ncbi:MAG TPA: hypothetical protein VLK29_08180 [Luteimonas sp.]|nr:hypothetical protein [Luteimonas sp.]
MIASSPREAWLHDLRNAINTALMSTNVARRLMEGGDVDRALGFLQDAEAACDRCRVLVNSEDQPPPL